MALLLLCLLVPVSSPDEAQLGQKPSRYLRPELLMEVSELARPQVGEHFVILDARRRPKYQAGHIPRAVWVDHSAWSKLFAAGQDQQSWAKHVGELGIDLDARVVVYDDNASKDAARIWWILRYWGIKDVRLLNGGWLAWQKSGGKISTDEPRPPVREVKVSAQPARLATKDQLLEALKAKPPQIIDTRSRGEYCGEEKTAQRNGAIPGAIHLEWIEVLDQKSQRFKTPEELAELFRKSGIALERPAITHCQSGGRAAVMSFALELMGAKQVGNYYKSWAEWGNTEETPVIKPGK